MEASDKTQEGPGCTKFDDSDTNNDTKGGGGGGAKANLDVTDTDHSGYYLGSQAIMVQVWSHSGEEVSTCVHPGRGRQHAGRGQQGGRLPDLRRANRDAFPVVGRGNDASSPPLLRTYPTLRCCRGTSKGGWRAG